MSKNMIPDNLPEKLAFDYDFIQKIGEGANGETWLAQHRFAPIKAAVKCLKLDKIDDIKTLELFNRESELLKSVVVNGVPECYDYYPPEENGNGYLVQEYIQAPSIQTMLDNGTIFSESQALMIAEQIANILVHLEMEYQPPIIHRDIKPSNILYNQKNRKVYLIDFGAVTTPQKRSGGSTVAGTFGYMPPEQIMGNVVIQSDYYALGATLLHMITGIPPYKLEADVFTIDLENTFKTNNIHVSNGLLHLLSSLLCPEIEKRPANAVALVNAIQIARGTKTVKTKKRLSAKDIFRKILEWFAPIGIRKASGVSSNHEPDQLYSIRTLENSTDDDKKASFRFLTRNWIRCDGMLRQYRQFKTTERKNNRNIEITINGIEYTFEANGRVWGGFCEGSVSLSLPHKCSVLYLPGNPRHNMLEFVYGIDDDIENG